MIRDFVPSRLQGKTYNGGKTPYAVLSFQKDEFEVIDCSQIAAADKQISKHIIARFACYGDAWLYAKKLSEAPVAPEVIVILFEWLE